MAQPFEVGTDPTLAAAVRRRMGVASDWKSPAFSFQVPSVAQTGPRSNVAPAPTYWKPKVNPPAPDAFSFLKPLSNAAEGVGNFANDVFNGPADAKGDRTGGLMHAPVIGGVLTGLNTIADAAVRTPVGAAALLADKALGTGLSGAAERANAGRPIWELPKTAYNVASEGIGAVASDPKVDALHRALAGATRVAQTAGEFAAPAVPGIGLVRGAIAGRAGKVADVAAHPPIKIDLPAAPKAPPLHSSDILRPQTPKPPLSLNEGAIPMGPRTTPETPAPAPTSFRDQIAASLARQHENPTADLSARHPVNVRDATNQAADAAAKPFAYRVGDLTPVGREDLTITPLRTRPASVPTMPVSELRTRIGARAPEDISGVPLDAEQLSARIGTKTRPQAATAAQASMDIEARQARSTGTLGASGMDGPLVGRAVGKGGSQLKRALIDKSPLDVTPGDLSASLQRQAKVHNANEAVINAVRSAHDAPVGQGDYGAVERALRNVVLLGGDLNHTRQRIRAAGLPAPTKSEMEQFMKAAPQSAVSSFMADEGGSINLGAFRKPTGQDVLSAWNLPKALKASLDLSAPLRQGIFLAAGHPKEFAGAFKDMLHALADDKFAAALEQKIASGNRPGLFLRLKDAPVTAKDEAFMSNLLMGDVNVGGKNVNLYAKSQNAFNTFLNKLSADVYDNTIAGWKAGGKTVTEADAKKFATVINHFTGRGDIPGMSQNAAAVLNGLFFSPRFIASRFQSIADAAGGLKPGADLASRQAAKDLVKFVGAGITILALAKANGAKVEDDPRSSAFGKIQIGPTQVDIWGGSQQVARYTAQFITGQRKIGSGKNAGDIQDYGRDQTLGRFVRSKLSPTASVANDIWGVVGGGGPTAKDRTANKGKPFAEQTIGRDFIGNPDTAQNIPGRLFNPLGLESTKQIVEADDNKVQGAVVALLNLLGAGTTTFDDEQSTATPSAAPTTSPTTAPKTTVPAKTKTAAPTFQFKAPSATPKKSSFKYSSPGTTASGGPKVSAALRAPQGQDVAGGDVQGTIHSVAQKSGIDPRLALATAYVESGFNVNAVGDNGDSHGLFQENVHGRGSGRAPDYSPEGQTARFAADVKRLLASGFTGTPGEIAAAAQRPYDPAGYARKVDAAYKQLG